MLRNVGSAILGYVVIFLVVFLLMTLFWMLLGADGAFEPGSWNVTGVWIILLLVAGFLAAYAGGFITAKVATDHRSVWMLAGLVFVLGIIMALPVLTGSMEIPAEARPDNLPMFDAMQKGQQPAWVAVLNPIIGVIGVWFGGQSKK